MTAPGRVGGAPDADAAVAMVAGKHFATCLDTGTGLGHYVERLAGQCDHIFATGVHKSIESTPLERVEVFIKSVNNARILINTLAPPPSEYPKAFLRPSPK